MRIGINPEGLIHYGSSDPFRRISAAAEFVDLARIKPEDRATNGPFTNPDGDPIPAALPSGFPATLGPRQTFNYFAWMNRSHPAGDYNLVTSGKGQVIVHPFYADGTDEWITPTIDGGKDVARTVRFRGEIRNLSLCLFATDPTDPVSRLDVYPPGVAEDPADPWNPAWIAGLAPFGVVRCMDLQSTNTSWDEATLVREWADRNRGLYTEAADNHRGIRYEHLATLANVHRKDLWVTIPDTATPDFVRNFAEFWRDNLHPARTVYVERSNEIPWNFAFPQAHRAFAAGRDDPDYAGLADEFERACRRHAKVSASDHAIFRDAYGEGFAARVRGVLAVQLFGGFTPVMLGEYRLRGGSLPPPLVATNLYFGDEAGTQAAPDDPASIIAGGVAGLMARCREVYVPRVLARLDGLRAEVAPFGAEIAAYEGGQHLCAPKAADADRLAEVFIGVNRHPDFEADYAAFLRGLADRGVSLFMHFSHIVPASNYGCWGALEYQGQDPATAPKYRALAAYAGSADPPRNLLDAIRERDALAAEHAALSAARKRAAAGKALLKLRDAAAAEVKRLLPVGFIVLLDGPTGLVPAYTSKVLPVVRASDIRA